MPTLRDGRFAASYGDGLGRHHGGVGHGALGVLIERQPFGIARGGNGGALHLFLLHQDALLDERILDLLEGDQDGLAVVRDLAVVFGPGALDLRLERAAVDQGGGELRADRPHRVAELQ